MPASEFFLCNALLPDATQGYIGIGNGCITEIVRNNRRKASFHRPVVDLDGALVLPAFTDGHMHLDKTVIGRKAGCTELSEYDEIICVVPS